MPKKKPMTLDELARLVNRGFDDIQKRLGDVQLEMATKTDLSTLAEDLRAELATKYELHEMEERLTAEIRKTRDLDRRMQVVEERLNQVEKRVR